MVDLCERGGRFITEYRFHTVQCTCGEHVSPHRRQAPLSSFGPRLCSTISLLTGRYHHSRREAVEFLRDVFAISISLGSVSSIESRVSQSLEPASDEVLAHVNEADVKHVDETIWLRDSSRSSAWVIASSQATAIRLTDQGRRRNLRDILPQTRGVLISDRASVFLYWPMSARQICWSHLLRLFVSFSERDGPTSRFGGELVDYTELVFAYWRQYRDGLVSQERLKVLIAAVQQGIKPCLQRAAAEQIKGVSGSCTNILKHWQAMWGFVDTDAVEPTNNHAERELRRLVLWRKRCFGTQSERGDRFVERMLTVCHTARKQGHRILDFLHHCYKAMLEGTSAPKLLTAT